MDKRNLFPDKYIGYHTFGLGVNNTLINEDPFAKAANGHEYVDLGLPSGTLWAKCNVGAETEISSGLYFAWGETQGYAAGQVGSDKNFNWDDYKYGTYDDRLPNYGITKYNLTDGKITLDLEDDAAHIYMGGTWRMPTKDQFDELVNETNHQEVTNYNGTGINGVTFTNKSDSSKVLFIPSAGYCASGRTNRIGTSVSLWSSLLDEESINRAFHFSVNNKGDFSTYNIERYYGRSVRGVLKINQ